jgi:hypothetical protein
MVAIEAILIITVLVLQPLILLLWALALYRIGVSFTANRTGEWLDNRVKTIGEELKP